MLDAETTRCRKKGDQSGAVCGDEGGEEGAVDESAGWEHVSLIFDFFIAGAIVCFFSVWDSSCVAKRPPRMDMPCNNISAIPKGQLACFLPISSLEAFRRPHRT